MKEILVIDNRDSFVYNLIELVERLSRIPLRIVRDEEASRLSLRDFSAVLLSPGPGLPQDYPTMMRLLQEAKASTPENCPPIFGVCLGMQAMAEACGGQLHRLPMPCHGHISPLLLTDDTHRYWQGLRSGTGVGRYHSWAVDLPLPEDLTASAYAADDRCLMALRHRYLPLFGVQFHPESIMSPEAEYPVKNWLQEIQPYPMK